MTQGPAFRQPRRSPTFSSAVLLSARPPFACLIGSWPPLWRPRSRNDDCSLDYCVPAGLPGHPGRPRCARGGSCLTPERATPAGRFSSGGRALAWPPPGSRSGLVRGPSAAGRRHGSPASPTTAALHAPLLHGALPPRSSPRLRRLPLVDPQAAHQPRVGMVPGRRQGQPPGAAAPSLSLAVTPLAHHVGNVNRGPRPPSGR